MNKYNASTQNETRRFQVRIGIDANTGTLVVDINNQQNIAGAGISMASRIMNLADENQILVGQAVYNILRHRENYTSTFKAFQATVKHDTQIPVYQFIGEHEGLNITPPTRCQTDQESQARKGTAAIHPSANTLADAPPIPARETVENYYPRIEGARDSLGDIWTPLVEKMWIPQSGGLLKCSTILRPGDVIDYVITASDPLGAELEYDMSAGNSDWTVWQKSNKLTLTITDFHIRKNLYVHIRIRSQRDYHAEYDYDDKVAFIYDVLPLKV